MFFKANNENENEVHNNYNAMQYTLSYKVSVYTFWKSQWTLFEFLVPLVFERLCSAILL